MAFTYHMVQVPPTIVVKSREHQGNEAAAYLEGIANHYAALGWEFYRVDTVGVVTKPGCLMSFLGRAAESVEYYVVTFRKTA
ncbi:MAG: DUF4177 domain-containing protein [Thermoanaerobaculaceae bacterium]